MSALSQSVGPSGTQFAYRNPPRISGDQMLQMIRAEARDSRVAAIRHDMSVAGGEGAKSFLRLDADSVGMFGLSAIKLLMSHLGKFGPGPGEIHQGPAGVTAFFSVDALEGIGGGRQPEAVLTAFLKKISPDVKVADLTGTDMAYRNSLVFEAGWGVDPETASFGKYDELIHGVMPDVHPGILDEEPVRKLDNSPSYN